MLKTLPRPIVHNTTAELTPADLAVVEEIIEGFFRPSYPLTEREISLATGCTPEWLANKRRLRVHRKTIREYCRLAGVPKTPGGRRTVWLEPEQITAILELAFKRGISETKERANNMLVEQIDAMRRVPKISRTK